MSILNHNRANHDATNDALDRVQNLLLALEIVHDDMPDNVSSTDTHRLALSALLNEVLEKSHDIPRLRSMEWAGLGGNTIGLSEDEIKRARGE